MKTPRCSLCRGAGHNRRNCPKNGGEIPPPPPSQVVSGSHRVRAALEAASDRLPSKEELQDVFDAADTMVGSGDPDYFDEERAKIERIRKQVWRALGWEDSDG